MAFKWFKKIFKQKSDYKPEITDEMRAQALETRRMNMKIRQLEAQMATKNHLNELQQMINGEPKGKGNQMEDMMINLLMNSLMTPKKQNDSFIPPSSSYGDVDNSLFPTTQKNVPINEVQNEQIVNLLNPKIPDNVIPQLAQLSDADILDIRQKIINKRGQEL